MVGTQPPSSQTDHRLARFRYFLAQEKGHSPQGVKRYISDIRLWESWLLESGSPETSESLRVFLSVRQMRPRRVQGFLAALRSYYRWRSRMMGEDIADITREIPRPRAGKRLPQSPSMEDLERLLEAATGEAEEALLRSFLPFLYGTGLRISECCALKYEQILWERGLPTALRVIGKGDRERIVPLSPMAEAAIQRWARHKPVTRGYVWTYLRPAYARRPIGVSWVQKKLKQLARRAGLDPRACTPHKFRHAYATFLANHEVGLDVLKELLGHSSVSTTQIYVQTSNTRLKEAVSRLRR